jgi:hypothetical protein
MNDNMNKEQGQAESPMASLDSQKFHKMHWHGMCCGHRFFWLRWLLGLIILAVVFCIGVKVGEFKGAFGPDFGGYRGHQMMRYYPRQAYPLGLPSGMMQSGGTWVVQTNSATATPAK